YLGIDREDKYDGGKLIPVYKDFTESKDPEKLKLLLLHNFEDVKGMFGLLPMLRYLEFFHLFENMPEVSIRTDEEIDDNAYDYELPVRAKKVQANYYKDLDGSCKQEVFMKLALPFELPSSLSGNLDGCFFKIMGKEATLRVPLYETELKYYYSNYRDYYYLPKEDMAIHKSIAEFVDKSFREKATPENCYTKKEGQYLLEWDLVFAPFFKEDYKDNRFFFDLNDNMKKSRFAMSLYASHVIGHILGES
ncbi:MAG: ribonuclease H-like domain-containing protein, partial [Butyrivibrio sp.]|nr:ribonuclease H-like domain-containing protein [Butyrivibrio sp.]